MLAKASWTEPSSEHESLQTIKELALSHAREGGQVGRDIGELILTDSFQQLCDYSLAYPGLSVLEARNCRQALAFYKKCRYLPLPGIDRKARARTKFVAAEAKCRETNEYFALRDQGLFNLESWADLAIKRAQAKISRVLGVLPKLSELDFRFGPGATTLTKKSDACVSNKLEHGLSCSEDLLPYASRLLDEMPYWSEYLQEGPDYVKIVKDPDPDHLWAIDTYGRVPVLITPGRVNFVPKDALTDRSVIVEGSLNVLAQGAIGRYMYKRLQASGIDLSDQTLNQERARVGSLTGGLATLDLVSASDMMAIAIVRELLPWEWYFFLSTMRSSEVTLDGKPMLQEKFSSMGNGYTFPLQSLIFWALASSIDTDSDVSVYGDDIIVRSDHALRVSRLLEICGFEVNLKKSFWTGPFRESCGADYVSGIDIRPFYHKELMTNAELFRLHNFYVRRDDPVRAESVKLLMNADLVIYGPDGYGDGHLLGDWIPKRHKKRDTHGYGGVTFDTYKHNPCKDSRPRREGDCMLPAYLSSTSFGEELKPIPPQDSLGRLSSFLRIFRKKVTLASEPLPEVKTVYGVRVKSLSLPGTNGYSKVSIYTFDSR